MPVVKNEYPILEYDPAENGVIRPNCAGHMLLPERVLLTFFGEVLTSFLEKNGTEHVHDYKSEIKDCPIHTLDWKGIRVGVVQAPVGSACISGMMDYLIAYGAKKLIACGGCGVLTDIPAGAVLVPTRALRDEGASYHYLPPAREIELDGASVDRIRQTLDELGVPHRDVKTWTTDAFFRETRDMVAYRVEEGCETVEMECATMASVAAFRGVTFGQLLYSGDILADADHYDDRAWSENISAREKLFNLSLEALIRL